MELNDSKEEAIIDNVTKKASMGIIYYKSDDGNIFIYTLFNSPEPDYYMIESHGEYLPVDKNKYDIPGKIVKQSFGNQSFGNQPSQAAVSSMEVNSAQKKQLTVISEEEFTKLYKVKVKIILEYSEIYFNYYYIFRLNLTIFYVFKIG